mgnify:FL=1
MVNMTQKIQKSAMDIQQQVVKKFLEQLKEDKVSDPIINRLKKVLEDKAVSEANIKKALLPDESSS